MIRKRRVCVAARYGPSGFRLSALRPNLSYIPSFYSYAVRAERTRVAAADMADGCFQRAQQLLGFLGQRRTSPRQQLFTGSRRSCRTPAVDDNMQGAKKFSSL